MIKVIKSQIEGTQSNSRRKGNFLVGESTVGYGPTSTTGFYNGITPPEGGYTLYIDKETGGPSIYVFTGGTELLNFCNSSFNANQTTIFGVIDWINQESDKFVDPNYFEFTVKTDNSGVSTSTQFKLPLVSSGSINFLIDWGDENSDVITTYNQNETTHTYSSAGTYTIKIAGIIKGFRFAGGGDRLKFLEVKNWGCLNINVNSIFLNCSNMTCTAVDAPRITATSFYQMFRGCLVFNGPIGNWDISSVTSIQDALRDARAFNQPLNNWNVSNVTTMQSAFERAYVFNQDIGNWDVSKVSVMHGMFYYAFAFNNGGQDSMGYWNTASLTNINFMFERADVFNQPIQNWNTSNLTTAGYTFKYAYAFNQDLSKWDVRKVTSFAEFMRGKNYSHLDSVYTSWSQQSVKSNVVLFFNSNKYTSAGLNGRNILVNTYGWTITDGGQV